jgi:hypothetical protein
MRWMLDFLSFFGEQAGKMAFAHVAQLVEHVLGKDEVISSRLIMGSRFFGWILTTDNKNKH